MSWKSEDSSKEYMIPHWGEGYFSVNNKGEFRVNPFSDDRSIEFSAILQELQDRKIQYPTVIRFHDILIHRVKNLFKNFINTMEKIEYKGYYMGVYPIKVNQMREVVEEITRAGKKYFMGLEAGSKAELLATLSFPLPKEAVCILNGYKDEEYLKLALMGRKMGRKMIIVLEKYSELEKTIKISKKLDIKPIIGIRARLESQGSGPWAESTGPSAKFGFTPSEILKAQEYLEEEGILDSFQLLHFHIGSQVPSLQTIKEAAIEATRIFADLVKSGTELRYLDIGGGLGVNYEGIIGGSSTSVNYRASDYIESILTTIKQICDEEEINHPDIISESGRYITAHHSCIVTEVFGSTQCASIQNGKLKLKNPQSNHYISELYSLLGNLSEENFQEAFYRSAQIKSEALQAYKHGEISLRDRSDIDNCHRKLLETIEEMDIDYDTYSNFFEKIEKQITAQYICNLSVFQSIPDSWAIEQVLPILPLTRLDEEPTKSVSLVDITCDSDGKIKKYLSADGKRDYIRMHKLKKNESYPIGIFLTGAYQDIMGDMHNLFGRLNEVHIYFDNEDPQKFYVEEVIDGNSTGKILSTLQYNPETMADRVKSIIDEQIRRGKIKPREGVGWIDYYENCLESYTYLQ